MRSRVLLLVAVSCTFSGLAGASLRPVLGRSNPDQNSLPPAYYDLEALDAQFTFRRKPQREWIVGVNEKGPVRLVIHPSRSGKSGLKVEVEVWNLSTRWRRVYPIDPYDYALEFRDATEKRLDDLYLRPPLHRRPLRQSELAVLRPTSHVGATYLLPDFYTRVKQARGMECRVTLRPWNLAVLKEMEDANWEMTTTWVKVPLLQTPQNSWYR